MSRPDPARYVWWLYALILVIVFLMLARCIVGAARADDARVIYCAMISRELVRIEVETGKEYSPVMVQDVLHYTERPDETLKAITPEAALKRYTTFRQMCEAMIDILPSLPKVDAATNDAWARSIASLANRFDGVAPAGDPPPDPGPEGWAEACASEYRTWQESDGTVIRRGSPERVRCPLVLKDGEWVVPE